MSWCCAIWFKRASSRPICTFFFHSTTNGGSGGCGGCGGWGFNQLLIWANIFLLTLIQSVEVQKRAAASPQDGNTHTHRATHTQTYTHSHTHKRWARRRRRSIPSTTASLQWTDQRCHLTSHCVCVCVWVCKEWSSVSHTHTTSTRSAQSNFYFSQSTKCGDDFSHFLALWSLGGTNNSAGWKLFGGSTKRRNDEIGIGKNFGFFFLIFILFGTECGSGRVSTGALVTIDWMRRMSEPALPDVRFSDSAGGPTAAESKQKETANVWRKFY